MCLAHKPLQPIIGASITQAVPRQRYTTARIDPPRIGIQTHSIGPSIINPTVQRHPIAMTQVAPSTQRRVWDIFSRFRK